MGMQKKYNIDRVVWKNEEVKKIEKKLNLPHGKEKKYSRTLTEMGKKAYIEEYFQNVDKLEQDYTNIEGYDKLSLEEEYNTIDKIVNTLSFRKGYEFAEALVKIDNIPERYKYLTEKKRTR